MNVYLATGGGGTGTPGINDEQKACFAESVGCKEAYLAEVELYHDANILQSFFYASDFTEKVIIPNCKDFLLDSGAFTFMQNAKAALKWEEYIEKYAAFINRNNIEKFFELDIDSIVGYETVLRYRERLESLTGKKPIPVWHKLRGIDAFREDCQNYPYVAIGGVVIKEFTKNEYDLFPGLIQIAHKYGAKIHGLGFTALSQLPKIHFDSVDSTSWVSGNRFGAIYYFDGKTMQKKEKPNGKRVKTNQVAIHNFCEWKKFCNYAEKNL